MRQDVKSNLGQILFAKWMTILFMIYKLEATHIFQYRKDKNTVKYLENVP